MRAGQDPRETQSLRIKYTDWDGAVQSAWVLKRPVGYNFYGLRLDAEAGIDRDTCMGDGTCWRDDVLRYLGADGVKYAAELKQYEPPTIPQATGAPTYSSETAYTASPVTFNANDFMPAGAVGPVTYRWRFENECASSPFGNPICTRGLGGPIYGAAVTGATVTHTWQLSRDLGVELTATDSQGRQAVHTFDVPVANVPAEVTVARDCSLQAVHVGCNNYTPTQAGQVMNLWGGVERAGLLDGFTVQVDWGDGTSSFQQGGPDIGVRDDTSLVLRPENAHDYQLHGTHTYAKAGFYSVRVAVVDRAGATDRAP